MSSTAAELRQATDVIAIPQTYLAEFRRDPVDALLKYGSLPQRARAPWFTEVAKVLTAMQLPDLITGAAAEQTHPKLDCKSLVASPDPNVLLQGVSDNFHATTTAYWHVHVDLALNKTRQGDAAGIAMGRILEDFVERTRDPNDQPFDRIVRTFEVPLAAQIVAPAGSQVFIGSIVQLILQLKQLRGFNITSFSFDGFQSAQASSELMLAGLVTAGMEIDEATGEITGLPKPFSVDRSAQPYRDTLEAVNEHRLLLPKYALLKKELRELERIEAGKAPDHPVGGSKDVADPVAGVVGYLSAFGHAELYVPEQVDRRDLEQIYDLPPVRQFGPGEEPEPVMAGFNSGLEPGQLNFNVE